MNNNGSSFPLSDSLFIIACIVARRNHVGREDISDCALSFVEHALKQEAEQPDTQELRSLAYWKQAAENWAKNYRRDAGRQRRGETVWPQTEHEDGQKVAFDPLDDHPGPDTEALHEELRGLFEQAMEELTTLQREFLRRHVVNEESYTKIAAETGRTPDAVRMIVMRACKRLRSYLERHGFDQKEAEDYLAMIAPPPPANVASPTTFP